MRNTKPEQRPAEEKLATQIITFVGVENGMYPYYTAKLLQAAKHDISVLIVDNSVSHDLYQMLPDTTDSNVRMLDKAVVVKDRQFTESVFKKFEVVIVYLGLCYDADYVERATKVYYLCDYSPLSEAKLHDMELPANSRSNIIFFDKASGKISEKRFLSAAGEEVFADREENVMVVGFDENDFTVRNEWNWGFTKALRVMSKDFREAIATIVAAYFGEQIKNVVKITKRI